MSTKAKTPLAPPVSSPRPVQYALEAKNTLTPPVSSHRPIQYVHKD